MLTFSFENCTKDIFVVRNLLCVFNNTVDMSVETAKKLKNILCMKSKSFGEINLIPKYVLNARKCVENSKLFSCSDLLFH